MATIHNNIKKLRLEQNLTLEEVGKRTNTTKQTIKRYEDAEISNIPYDRIIALAKCFNVSPSYLMGWEDLDVNAVTTDVKLTNMEANLKEYALKLAELPKEAQEIVMSMIDMMYKK